MRISTGLSGLDEMIQGGLPVGSAVVLQGPPGQEKMRLALTFLADGLKAGASGLVVIASQSPDSVLAELRNLGVDLDAVVHDNRLRIVDWYSQREEPVQDVEERGVVLRASIDLTNVGVALSRAIAALGGDKPKRAVVELLSPASSVYEVSQVYAFAQSSKGKFARFAYTALVLLEKEMHAGPELSTLHQPFDGVIELERVRVGDDIVRKIGVLHLKDTTPDSAFRVLEMTEEGLRVVREAPKRPTPTPPPKSPSAGAAPSRPTTKASETPESPEESPTRAYLIMQIARERLKLNPDDADALFATAAAQATLDDARGALDALERLAKIDGHYPGLWVLKTKLHARLGQVKEAQLSRRRAEETDAAELEATEVVVACPLCETPVSENASRCPKCGAKFLDEEDIAGELDALGQVAIQEKVQEELHAKDILSLPEENRPSRAPSRPPAPAPQVTTPPKEPGKPSPRRGMTNGLVKERGPRAAGMTNGLRGRTNGLTNGLRGRTNGLTNGLRGRTNGLTNGLGRTNGLTNGMGRTNGLTNGLGHTNGVTNGLTNGLVSLRRGLTNGLTNGNGFTNGLGSPRFQREVRLNRWKLYVIPVVAVALLLVPLFTPPDYQGRAYPIHIDGSFNDWLPLPKVTLATQGALGPNVDLVRASVEDNIDFLAVYVEVRGQILAGGPAPDRISDAVDLFLDIDRSPSTGYQVMGLGADRLIEVAGWNGQVTRAVLMEFDANRDGWDWGGWFKGTSVAASASGSQLEFQADWNLILYPKAPVDAVVAIRGWDGQRDVAERSLTSARPYLEVRQDSSAPPIAIGSTATLLTVDLRGVGGDVAVRGLNVTLSGTFAAGSLSSIALQDGSGGTLSQRTVLGRTVSFDFGPLTVPRDATTRLYVRPTVGVSDGATIGASVAGARDVVVQSAGVVLVGPSKLPSGMAYLGTQPTGTRVDGGFGEWSNTSQDPTGDEAPFRSWDHDTTAYALQGNSGNAYFHLLTAGTLLNGTVVPAVNLATDISPAPADSDRDTVPDSADTFPSDFDNDGTPDAGENGDYDSDGFLDYGFSGGTDQWLNTTIPAGFPAPYGGRAVSLFIGPAERPVERGLDALRFYLDLDGSAATGYTTNGIGADYLVEVTGKGGEILGSTLMQFNGPYPGAWSWALLGPAVAAKDQSRIEGELAGLAVTGASRGVFDLTAWGGIHDDSSPSAPVLAPAAFGTLAVPVDGTPLASTDLQSSTVSLDTFSSGYGGTAADKYGFNVSFAGRVDETSGGYDDVIVGAPYVDFGAITDRGAIYLHFGTSSFAGTETRYFHDETITANTVTTEKLVTDAPDGANAKTRSVSTSATGHLVLDEWTTQRLGITSIPAGTWTFYYWGSISGTGPVVHFDSHIYKRSAAGTLTAIDGTDGLDATDGVAPSVTLTTTDTEYSATFSMGGQTLDMSDALVIRIYAHITTLQNGRQAAFQLDHSTRNSRVVTTLPSKTVDAADADVVIYGDAAGDHFGWSVSDAGDVNGDGYGDVLVGAPEAGGAGRAYLVYGRSTSAWSSASGLAIGSVTNVVVVTGQGTGDKFGASVSGAGNVDGSGNVDFVVGAPGFDGREGRAYVFYGDGSIPTSALKADAILASATTDGLYYKQGSFTRKTDGTGTQTVSGVGFQPKALIIWYARVTDETQLANDYGGFGFATSTSQRYAVALGADNGLATTNTARGSAAAIVRIFSDGTPTLDGAADLASFNADGFTLSWTTNPSPAQATVLHYVALGGPDITNAYVGQFTGPSAGVTGNRAFSGVGFQGNFALFITTNQAALGDTTGESFGLGVATGPTKRAVLAGGANDGATAVTHAESYVSTSKALVSYKTGAAAADLTTDNVADFASWDSDGFTLNYAQATGGNILFWGLILKGGKYDVGSLQTPTGVGDQSVTSLGFKPRGVMFASDNRDVLDTEGGNFERMIGAGTDVGGTIAEGVVWSFNRNIINSDSDMHQRTAKSVGTYSSTGTVINEADFKSSDASGFTLTHTAVDVGSKRVLFWAFGDAAGSDRFGLSVSDAGDVNADGKADIVVGAPGAAKAYVFHVVSDPVSNRYFDSDASGWTYAETDTFGAGTGAWENSGGTAGLFSGAGSYKFSFSPTVWYYHSETVTVNTVTTEKLVTDGPDGASIQSRSVMTSSVGHYFLDEWTTPQLGWTSIPSGTWQFYYWGYAQNPMLAHFDVHIYKRDTSGTLTAIDGTDGLDGTDGVADSPNLGTAGSEVTATFAMSIQTLATTDAIVVRLYLDVTSASTNKAGFFEFDHSSRNSRVAPHFGQDFTPTLTSSSFTSPTPSFDTVFWRMAWTASASSMGSATYRIRLIVRNGADTADVSTAYDSGALSATTSWNARAGTVTGLASGTSYRLRFVVDIDNPNTASTPTVTVNVDDAALVFAASASLEGKQFGRPDADVDTGTWTPTPIYQRIDEGVASDTDYVSATATGTDEVSLSDVLDPKTSASHVIRYRARATGTGPVEQMRLELYQATNLIASTGDTTITRDAFNVYSYTLTTAQADAITDYADLRFRIVVSALGVSDQMDVSWAEFEVPGYGTDFGFSVSYAGNVNNDGSGYADVIVGAPSAPRGTASIFYGGSPMDTSVDVTIVGSTSGDRLGYSVEYAGDLSADGIADVVVGVPYADSGSLADAGAVFVFKGSAALGSVLTPADADYSAYGSSAGDHFGWSVDRSGDTNGDGQKEIIVGAPDATEPLSGSQVGGVWILKIPEFEEILLPLAGVLVAIPFIGAVGRLRRRRSPRRAASTQPS